MSEQRDDMDLEVSSLQPAAGPTGTDAQDRNGASPPDTRALRLPRQQHLLRAGSVFVLLTLLVGAVLLIPTGNRAAVLHLLTPPTPVPTATPQAGDDAFLWEHSVPWGELVIDGKPGPDVRGSAIIGQDEQVIPQGAAFHLARGRHTLQYRADPFPTLACRVSVPASRDDTCPLAQGPYSDFSWIVADAPATRLLDLQATIDRLPTASVDALVATTQTFLTSLAGALPFGMLAVGDHFLDPSGQLTQDRSAWRIAPQFRLDSSVEQYDGVSCVTLCTATGIFVASSAQGWAVLAPVTLTWRYTTPAGQVVFADGPALPIGEVPYNVISLRVGWNDGAWQTPTAVLGASETDPVICHTGAHALNVVQLLSTEGHDYQWPVAASTAELGCLYAGSKVDSVSRNPISPMALVLYRAGALIAVNRQAHQIFPSLPVASDHERILATAVAHTSLG